MLTDQTQITYRSVFGSAEGRKALGMLLIDLGFFDEADTPEQTALRNFAKRLLNKLGLFEIENIDKFVNKIFEIAPKGQEQWPKERDNS